MTSEKLRDLASPAEGLTVRIFSFSFHREPPADDSGNGGGFVFDARSLPNPGREEQFRTMTGKDAAVIEYLNRQESVHQYLASALSLVDASVTTYRRRGFRNLMVSFGCTGGQHRSVYLAEQLAKHLQAGAGVEVVVRHIELEKMGAAEKPSTMKAMILAAGLGTRLRPLTDDRPKALVEVAGRTLLEIALSRLRAFGVREVIVNAHHYADMIVDYLNANRNFGMRIEVSREEVLLDTGGGLKKAAWFFLDPTASVQEPFILHNVDIISTIDLAQHDAVSHRASRACHAGSSRPKDFALSTLRSGWLALRPSNRQHVTPECNQAELVRPARELQILAFSGIHVISPHLFAKLSEDGAFSIIDAYLHLAAQGEKIVAFHADEYAWRDLGRPGECY